MWFAKAANAFAGYGAQIGDNDNMFFADRFNNSVRYALCFADFGGPDFRRQLCVLG